MFSLTIWVQCTVMGGLLWISDNSVHASQDTLKKVPRWLVLLAFAPCGPFAWPLLGSRLLYPPFWFSMVLETLLGRKGPSRYPCTSTGKQAWSQSCSRMTRAIDSIWINASSNTGTTWPWCLVIYMLARWLEKTWLSATPPYWMALTFRNCWLAWR